MSDHASSTGVSTSEMTTAALLTCCSDRSEAKPIRTAVSTVRSAIMRPPTAAEFIGVTTQCLAKWRQSGGGPPFVRIGKKAVGYEVGVLKAWLRAGRRTAASTMVKSGETVRTPAAAKIIGVSVSCMEKWRVSGHGPPFVRLGKKAVGYEVDALQAWLRAGRRVSTSDLGGGEDA